MPTINPHLNKISYKIEKKGSLCFVATLFAHVIHFSKHFLRKMKVRKESEKHSLEWLLCGIPTRVSIFT